MNKPRMLVFASGSGSGFQELVENARTGVLEAEIVALVTDHPKRKCRERAEALGIPIVKFTGKPNAENYQRIVQEQKAEWIALSGWLKLVMGLDPRRTVNIHPGPLPGFGGSGMYGHFVHEAVMNAFHRGEIVHSAVSMHFVTDNYDEGPVFFRYPVLIRPTDDANSLGERINKIEHGWQAYITNLVVQEKISWDGADPQSLTAPDWYPFL